MTAAAIEAKSLTKEYDNGRGCRDVTITVGKGKPLASSALMVRGKVPLSKCW